MENDMDYREELYNTLMENSLLSLICLTHREVYLSRLDGDVDAYKRIAEKTVEAISKCNEDAVEFIVNSIDLSSISDYERIQIIESNADTLVKVKGKLTSFLAQDKNNKKRGEANEKT